MTISSSNNKDIYTGNGSNRVFSITFPVTDVSSNEILIYKVNENGFSTLVEANYTLDLNALTVTYPTVVSGLPVLTSSEQIVILRQLNLTQGLDLRNQGSVAAEDMEASLDRLTMITQQLQEQIDRASLTDVSQDSGDTDIDAILAEMNDLLDAVQTSASTASSYKSAALDAATSATANAASSLTSANTASSAAAAALVSANTAANAAAEALVSANAAATASMRWYDRGDPSAADFDVGDLTADGNWHDMDLSSIAPAGCYLVLLRTSVASTSLSAPRPFDIRKKGNSNALNMAAGLTQVTDATISDNNDHWVTPDSNRVVEYRLNSGTYSIASVTVGGWFK